MGGGLDEKGVEKRLTFGQYWVAGALAAVPISIIEVPVDLLKVKLQAQGSGSGAEQYDGVVDAARKIFNKWGIRGLWQGGGATLLRNVPCFAGYFAGATHTKNLLTAPGEKSSIAASMAGGSVGGFLFWGIFYPLEMLKTRMQADALDPAERKYKSIADCWNKTMAEGGLAGFYKGYAPCVMRAVVVNSAIFGAFSMAKQYLA
jgi:solute carrier family 25 carnitine/acylcarnitine transporter 20/29